MMRPSIRLENEPVFVSGRVRSLLCGQRRLLINDFQDATRYGSHKEKC